MLTHTAFKLLLLGGVATLAACAATPTESEFGNALRHTMAQQRATPAPAPDVEPTADGERLESVLTVYRTSVGDPSSVVEQRTVDQGQGSR